MSDKTVKIKIETTADSTGAKQAGKDLDTAIDKAQELEAALTPRSTTALDEIPDAAKPAAAALDDVADRALDVVYAMNAAAGATRDEQEELVKLRNLADLSEAALASMNRALENDPTNQGNIKGQKAAKEMLDADRAAVASMERRIAARIREAKAADQLTESTKKLSAAEKEQRADERAQEQAMNVRRIRQNQIAQGVAFAAQQMAGATDTLRKVSEAAKGVDKDLANNLENVAVAVDSLQSSVAGAATGFQAGGPPGAILGALTGLAAPSLKKAFDELSESLKKVAESKLVSAGLPAKLEAARKALDVKQAAESWRQLRENIAAALAGVEASQALKKIQRDLNQYLADENVRVAEATGVDVAGAQKNAQDVSRTNAAQQLAADLANAGNALNDASSSYQIAVNASEQATRMNAANQAELAEEARKLKEAMERARLNYQVAEGQAGADGIRNGTGPLNDRRIAEGKKTSDAVNTVVDRVEVELGDVAEQPNVRCMIDRVKELAADGIQAGEQNEVTSLINTLVQGIRNQSDESRKNYLEIIGAVNASVEVQRGLRGELYQMKGKIRSLEQAARYPNR